MERALGQFIVQGIETSISLHQAIFADPGFRAGRFDTKFMERFLADKVDRISLPVREAGCRNLQRGTILNTPHRLVAVQGFVWRCSCTVCAAQSAVDWPAYNGGVDGDHYSRLTQINRAQRQPAQGGVELRHRRKGRDSGQSADCGADALCVHADAEGDCAGCGDGQAEVEVRLRHSRHAAGARHGLLDRRQAGRGFLPG